MRRITFILMSVIAICLIFGLTVRAEDEVPNEEPAVEEPVDTPKEETVEETAPAVVEPVVSEEPTVVVEETTNTEVTEEATDEEGPTTIITEDDWEEVLPEDLPQDPEDEEPTTIITEDDWEIVDPADIPMDPEEEPIVIITDDDWEIVEPGDEPADEEPVAPEVEPVPETPVFTGHVERHGTTVVITEVRFKTEQEAIDCLNANIDGIEVNSMTFVWEDGYIVEIRVNDDEFDNEVFAEDNEEEESPEPVVETVSVPEATEVVEEVESLEEEDDSITLVKETVGSLDVDLGTLPQAAPVAPAEEPGHDGISLFRLTWKKEEPFVLNSPDEESDI